MSFKRRIDKDEEPSDAADFESLLKESFSKPERKLSVGDRINAEVLSVGKEQIIVGTGTRFDGLVQAADFKNEQGELTVKSGDKVDLFVTYIKGAEIFLSTNATTQNLASDIQEAFSKNLPVPGKVDSVNKGGFQVIVFGKSAFCPISQMDLKRIEKPEEYVGQKFEFKITQFTDRNLVVSRRKVLEDGQGAALASFKDQRQVGDTVAGTVTRIEPYGAFIEIAPGLEGLAHISELSWARIAHPKDVVEVGQAVSAKITRIEQEERRLKISLTLKQEQNNPWQNLPSQFKAGRVVSGKVTRCMPFGAFVELQPGIEGLIPLSELSNTKRASRADEFVKEGEQVAVMIKELNPTTKRISLSLKDAVDAAASASESQDIRDYAASQEARGSGNLPSALAAKMQAALDKKSKTTS